MSELFMIVSLYAKQGREDALRQDLVTVVKASKSDPGSMQYDMFEDRNDPRRFIFFEHWASDELQQKHHTQTEHIRLFQERGAANVERIEIFYKMNRVA